MEILGWKQNMSTFYYFLQFLSSFLNCSNDMKVGTCEIFNLNCASKNCINDANAFINSKVARRLFC